MGETRQLTITLPSKLAEMVQEKVASGKYATESEVIQQGLLTLEDRDQNFENWLIEEVVPAYEEMKANPSLGIPIEEIENSLKNRFPLSSKAK